MCIVDGCSKPNYGHGFCVQHLAEKRRREKGILPRPNQVRGTYKKPCTVEGCERINKCGGLCAKHWQEKRRRDRGVPLWKPRGPCTIEGCERIQHAKGFCSAHYQLLKRNGDPLVNKRPNGSGHINVYGYKHISVNGKQIPEHRHVMEQTIGRKLLRHESVHHKNGVKTDNRPENLELWSKSQPWGQRVEDKLAWAREIIELYGRKQPLFPV